MALTFSTINVRCITTTFRAQSVLTFLSTVKSDVILLQECGLPFKNSYFKWEQMWSHGPSYWSGSNENKNDGVAVLINNPHVLVKGCTAFRNGRVLLLNLTFLGKDFKVINVYGFSDKHERFTLLEDLQSHLLGRAPLILAGDFNSVLTRADRRGAGVDFKVDKASTLLNSTVRDFRLTDCFKTLHPREEGLTWFSDDGTKASRIDYCFTRDAPPTDARLTPVFFSDHSMLSCTLSLSSGVTVGKGLWKLNCSLLEDEEAARQYREQFRDWQTLQDCFDTRAQWWEMVKGRTKAFFSQLGRDRKKKADRCMVGLQKRLERYFILRNQGIDFNYEIKEVKQEMTILSLEKSKGVILRSKERDLEEGEKCTRYFFKKILGRSGTMSKLKNKEGNMMEETEDILKVVETFYGELFGEKDILK